MKRFLSQTLIFFLIPTIAFAVLAVAVLAKTSTLVVDADISEIYAGDSHIQCTVVDSLLPHSKNVGHESESYYLTYHKLNRLLATNPQIKTVYLGYSYHNLSSYYDDFIFGKYSNTISPSYFFILPIAEKMRMLSLNRNHLMDYCKSLTIASYKVLTDDSPFMGGHVNPYSDTTGTESYMKDRLEYQFLDGKHTKSFSAPNLTYLNKIIDLCRASQVRLVLMDTPLHPYYKANIPAAYVARYHALIDSSRLEMIDFASLQLPDSFYIPDGDHVSHEGAYLATQILVR